MWLLLLRGIYSGCIAVSVVGSLAAPPQHEGCSNHKEQPILPGGSSHSARIAAPHSWGSLNTTRLCFNQQADCMVNNSEIRLVVSKLHIATRLGN